MGRQGSVASALNRVAMSGLSYAMNAESIAHGDKLIRLCDRERSIVEIGPPTLG
jgi:hypothetical protein